MSRSNVVSSSLCKIGVLLTDDKGSYGVHYMFYCSLIPGLVLFVDDFACTLSLSIIVTLLLLLVAVHLAAQLSSGYVYSLCEP
jgi:hypothetical protein